MIVPEYWAEALRQHKASKRKQVTVRRFGWSDADPAEAQAMADARADEALRRILSGDPVERRERKVPYNGASGLPIREQVLARHGDEVITRNAYGAHCLNSPHALFADIDFAPERSFKTTLWVLAALAAASIAAGVWLQSARLSIALVLVALAVTWPLAASLGRLRLAARGGAERVARQRVERFLAAHPAWAVRLYRTPAGLRLLATHQPFDPRAEETRAFFAAVHADATYVRMCVNQNCFRARLTAKPWRIGIAGHMRPRPGVWPVQPSLLAKREAWVAVYEARAAGFAACRYVESLGSGVVHASLKGVIELHDRASKALVPDAPLG